MTTSNYQKHVNSNPIQKFLINNFYRQLLFLARGINPDRILDVGCGEGFTLDKLKRMQIGRCLEGIDFSSDSLEIAKKIFPDLRFAEGNIYNLPYEDRSFDLVICTEVLEHLENPKMALREMKRVSKDYLLVSVPHEPWFMLANFLRGKNIRMLGNHPDHVNHWTSRGFQTFLKINELKVIGKKNPFAWILVLAKNAGKAE